MKKKICPNNPKHKIDKYNCCKTCWDYFKFVVHAWEIEYSNSTCGEDNE